MRLKHLQLNTSTLRNPKAIIDFMHKSNVDLACLQEICYPINGINPLGELSRDEYGYSEGIHFYYHPKNQIL